MNVAPDNVEQGEWTNKNLTLTCDRGGKKKQLIFSPKLLNLKCYAERWNSHNVVYSFGGFLLSRNEVKIVGFVSALSLPGSNWIYWWWS